MNEYDFEICNKSFEELFSELKPSQTIFIEEVGDVIKTFGILDMKIDDKSLKADCLNFEWLCAKGNILSHIFLAFSIDKNGKIYL